MAVMKAPCDSCPFTTYPKAVRLTAGRVRELCKNALDNNGGSFPCHKTTVDVEDEDGHCDRANGSNSQECAGSLLFGHKQGKYNQLSRILGRIGAWTPDSPAMKAALPFVFASTRAMLATALDGKRRRNVLGSAKARNRGSRAGNSQGDEAS